MHCGDGFIVYIGVLAAQAVGYGGREDTTSGTSPLPMFHMILRPDTTAVRQTSLIGDDSHIDKVYFISSPVLRQFEIPRGVKRGLGCVCQGGDCRQC